MLAWPPASTLTLPVVEVPISRHRPASARSLGHGRAQSKCSAVSVQTWAVVTELRGLFREAAAPRKRGRWLIIPEAHKEHHDEREGNPRSHLQRRPEGFLNLLAHPTDQQVARQQAEAAREVQERL